MLVTVKTDNLSEAEKKKFEEYLKGKMERLHGRIEKHYPDPDTVKLDVRMDKLDKHSVFDFEYVLTGPHNLHAIASHKKHTITEAMDKSTDRLEREIKEHFERLMQK